MRPRSKKEDLMDYFDAVKDIYEHVENDHVDKAVTSCLRLSNLLEDHFHTAIFLRELYSSKEEFWRALFDYVHHLDKGAQKLLVDKAAERWLETRTVPYNLCTDENGDPKSVVISPVGEMDSLLSQTELSIKDLTVPPGMGEFDTAAFTDRYKARREYLRAYIGALSMVRNRIKTRCLTYATHVERQLQVQAKSQNFLHQIQNEVNNYFETYSEEVYVKLQKATELVDSNDPEDCSLLLAQVRRAIKAAADFFYPPAPGLVKCSDGVERELGDREYLNRIEQFMMTKFQKSTSRDLMKAGFQHIAVLARRLNDMASKGVHGDVSIHEAKQGLLGLYMLLYNIIVKVQNECCKQSAPGE
jgi:hypothetical protein